jgi:solute carrier family 13 (sodium-dependent dicarboxylate transporter), member 2/3/5
MRLETGGIIAGLALGGLMWLLPPPEGMSLEAWRVAAVGVVMALWWLTEAVPPTVTALLPMLVFPLLGFAKPADVASGYMQPIIFLFLGGSLLALAMERWGMHKRVALAVLKRASDEPRMLILAFMIATAFLSMWISNTATTLIMLPIAVSVIAAVAVANPGHHEHAMMGFRASLVLGVAYAANIGGLGTLVGTPTNAIAAGMMQKTLGAEITFLDWMKFGVPLVVLGVPLAWFILTRIAYRFQLAAAAPGAVAKAIGEPGPWSAPEQRLMPVLLFVVAGWMFLPLIEQATGLDGLDDATFALLGASLLFIIPAGDGTTLLRWSDAKGVPWDVLLLFGGGLALAEGMTSTGLAAWIGDSLSGFADLPPWALVLLVVGLVVIVTEFASNVATASGFLPILAGFSGVLEFPAVTLAMAAALAASWGFAMPAGTGPNALAYATGYVRVPQMIRAGVLIDIAGIPLIALVCFVVVGLTV